MVNKIPSPQSVVVPVSAIVGFDVEEYVGGYEFRGDEGGYMPTEKERELITDAIHGVMSELSCLSAPAPSSLAGGEVRELIDAASEVRDLLKATPAMNGREYIGVGLRFVNAIEAARRAALSPEAPAREGVEKALHLKLIDTLKPFAEVAEKLKHCHVVEICEPTPDNPSRNIIPMPREWFERAADDLEVIAIQLHSDGVLSEGQTAKLTGLDRVEVRKQVDALTPRHEAPAEGAGEREARLDAALTKINSIRNSIIGSQRMHFSEHVYPLVAALEEAGYEGDAYEKCRDDVGTLIQQRDAAEAALAECRARSSAPEAREEALGNLLAVIHGDGGHRALEVGTKQAALEAEKIVAGLFADPDPEASAEGAGVAYGADHQPWCQPGDQTQRAFRLRFEDPDMREMVWTGPDAEKEALAAYNQYAPAWNVYLFSGHPRAAPSADKLRIAVEALGPFAKGGDHRTMPGLSPSYTVADFGDGVVVTVADFRRAAEALIALEAEGAK